LARKWESFSLVALLLVASFTGILLTPSVSAAEPGDLAINATLEPREDQWASSWDSILFTATVENQGLQDIANRAMWWYACEGEVTAQACKSNYDDRGSFYLPMIYSGTTDDVSASSEWNPSGDEGTFTIVYSFDVVDQDSSDDVLSFQINLTQSYVDLAVDSTHDPTADTIGLATYNGALIFNTDTEYTFDAKGEVSACGTCNFVAQIGWQLWDSSQTTMLSEAYSNITNLPSWGGISPFTRSMPAFSHDSQGAFFLEWGLFASTGTPYGDLNPLNDVSGVDIRINNALDIQATSMVPGHDANSADYFYGEDMASVEITNKGNVSVALINVAFQIYDPIGDVDYETQCQITNFAPGQIETCEFDITVVGSQRTLTISIPVSFAEGTDINMGDNSLSETADVLAGSIGANIVRENSANSYTTGDQIMMTARTSNTAAGPLNYSWWVSGIINIGYGKDLNISGSTLGLGDHTITLRVTDTFGELESVHTTISLFNYVSLDNEPYFTGEATTQAASYFKHESSLPVLGTKYSVSEGKQPLLLLSFEILSEDDDSNNTGLDTMDIKLNMSALLPSNIPLETVDIRMLSSLDDNVWFFPNEYKNNDDGTFDVVLRENAVIMIIGVSPGANITSGNISKNLLPGGVIELGWNASGDLSNPYVGSWNIYRLSVIDGAGTIFPDPDADFNQFIWEQLTLTSLVGQANIQDSSWTDPVALNSSTCASYAIMPADREGTPNLDQISVSRDENGQSSVFCGDAIPPSSTVTNFQVSTAFTNSTECFKLENNWDMCYDLNMTWVWPTNEPSGIVSWNLYRTEQQPSQIDLSFIQPLETGLTGTPGETGHYNQSGEVDDMIRPYRTFYYILAPVDSVGNELFLANYPTNSVRVTISDEWWDYNQHLIPLPPEELEPPLGVDWLGDLTDYMEEDEFKTTGLVTLIVLVTSLISLPLLMKKRKRLSRIMAARRKRSGANSANDDFEDFFD
jgi:hypothetical protein